MRFFIGGFRQPVTEEEISQRFTSFGANVSKVDIIPEKGSAFVDAEISDLQFKKCQKALTDSKWKGGLLRVQVAKEHYIDRLEREKKEAIELELDQLKKAKKQKAVKRVFSRSIHGKDLELVTDKNCKNRKNWRKIDYGRAVAMVNVKMVDPKTNKKELVTIHPSNYKNNLKRLKCDEEVLNNTSVAHLTWNAEDITKKKKIRFTTISKKVSSTSLVDVDTCDTPKHEEKSAESIISPFDSKESSNETIIPQNEMVIQSNNFKVSSAEINSNPVNEEFSRLNLIDQMKIMVERKNCETILPWFGAVKSNILEENSILENISSSVDEVKINSSVLPESKNIISEIIDPVVNTNEINHQNINEINHENMNHENINEISIPPVTATGSQPTVVPLKTSIQSKFQVETDMKNLFFGPDASNSFSLFGSNESTEGPPEPTVSEPEDEEVEDEDEDPTMFVSYEPPKNISKFQTVVPESIEDSAKSAELFVILANKDPKTKFLFIPSLSDFKHESCRYIQMNSNALIENAPRKNLEEVTTFWENTKVPLRYEIKLKTRNAIRSKRKHTH